MTELEGRCKSCRDEKRGIFLPLSLSLSEIQRDASGNGNKSACHLIAATLTPVTGSRGQMELNFTSELAR